MARMVLIEFEDDDQAQALCDMITKQTLAGKRYRVAGVFARPRSICQCPRVEGYHKDLVVRGSKFGWNTCTVCRRAKPGSHYANNLMAATDLLDMPGKNLMRGLEYRADVLGFFEVPTKNINRDHQDPTPPNKLKKKKKG